MFELTGALLALFFGLLGPVPDSVRNELGFGPAAEIHHGTATNRAVNQ